MSYLFEINSQSVKPEPSLLMVKPFDEIWNRTKDKKLALKEFAYIEFMASAQRSNPFSGYPENNRSDIIIENLFSDEYPNWEPDDLIMEGVKFVKDIQTEGSITYSYYLAARTSAEKMKEFFAGVDLNERNDKGMPIYKPKDVTSALIDTDKVLQNLDALQKKVEEEIYQNVKVKSDKKISPFANPSSLRKHG